jgi:nicotinate-nucleotide pyrophosphorylase (carboxylating)
MEAENFEQIRCILGMRVDVIMLDNFTGARLQQAVLFVQKHRRGNPLPHIEVSGGITLDNVRRIARAGVERISIGSLTHSSPNISFTMEFF